MYERFVNVGREKDVETCNSSTAPGVCKLGDRSLSKANASMKCFVAESNFMQGLPDSNPVCILSGSFL